LTEEEKMLKDSVANFAKSILTREVIRKMEKEEKLDPVVVSKCFENGFLGIEIPEKYSGSGLSFMSSILAIEEVSKFDPVIGGFIDLQNTILNTIFLKWGNEEQKSKYLPKLATNTIGSFCLSESGSGSDAFALQTNARKEGDNYIINGTKCWISAAREAGVYVVMATLDKNKGYKGITSFIIDRENPGISIGKIEKKMGLQASSTCEVIFKDCVVNKKSILGKEGEGYKLSIEILNEGRIGIAAQQLGVSQGALNEMIPYINQRKQFGKSISSFQGVQFDIAQMSTEIEAARLLTYNAARLKENGKNFVKEAAMAKLYSSLLSEKVASKCLELLGGVGYTKEFGIEKLFRDCKVGQIYEGTSNIQLLTIAKEVLKNYQ